MTDSEFLVSASIYLVAGFALGFFIVRDGKCESPAGTWLFATIAGPLFLSALALILLPFAPFYALVRLLGIESAEVGNDRF